MMNNVIICMLNSQYIHSSLAPWCLLSGIREFGKGNINARVIESNINAEPQELIRGIVDSSPALVGFCCYIWNIEKVIYISEKIKKAQSNCVIVLGGPEVSFNASHILSENPFVDYVLSGEGELPFAMLCDAIAFGDSSKLLSIPGICARTEDGLYISEPYISDKTPPSPYSEDYLNALSGKISYIESSRGCPFSCAFCLSGGCGSVRFFDVEETKRSLIRLACSGTKTIKFVDRTFNANSKRAIEIWKFIKEEYGKSIPENVCVHFEIAGDLLNAQCLEILSEMPKGSIQLEIGIQSFNEKTLEAINRKANCASLCENIKKLMSFKNIHIHTDLIAGLPYEDFDSFRSTFNKAFALGSNMLQLGFLKLLHGSSMRTHRDSFPCEYSNKPPYEVISTPWLPVKDIQKLKLVEKVNDRISNSNRFKYSLEYILSSVPFSAFDIFLKFGEHIGNDIISPIPLFDLAKLYYDFFSEFPEIDKIVLCDKMICDFLSHSRYGRLPAFLKRKNPGLKRVLEYLSENPATKKPQNAVRAAAILESEKTAVYCDSGISKSCDREFLENGHYRLKFIKLSELD